MIPAMLFLLVSSLATTAFCMRRLIEPACPTCARRSWRADSSVLCCARCGWSNVEQPSPALATIEFQTDGRRAA